MAAAIAREMDRLLWDAMSEVLEMKPRDVADIIVHHSIVRQFKAWLDLNLVYYETRQEPLVKIFRILRPPLVYHNL